jgi:hypothetical protein
VEIGDRENADKAEPAALDTRALDAFAAQRIWPIEYYEFDAAFTGCLHALRHR